MIAKKAIKSVNTPVLQPVFNFSLRSKYIFLAAMGFIFYVNSLFNKYALDDTGIILKNSYVKMGFKGIPKILTSDSYASYYSFLGGKSQLSGGRYRPLSEIIFAIEHQVLGGSALLPFFCHFINVLAYMACIIALFYFLENFLLKKINNGSDIAFLSAFLFTIHPIHTEVVANIKSLDEILSLLFILLTFIYSFKYSETRKNKHLLISTGAFLLALLSKEYAVTLLFFIPFLLFLLENKKPSAAIVKSVPYYGIFALYLLLRYNAIGFHSHVQNSSIMANPYLYASPLQKIATEWFVLGKYLRLLFFPYPLSADYSYNQVAYHSFSDLTVLLSILIYASIFIGGILLALRKSVFSFAVFFFLFNIFMISNFVFDIGATMGERLVFHASIGFFILVSVFLLALISKLKWPAKKGVIAGTLLLVELICFAETITRNAQWKDDTSLFVHDVGVVPNSFLANTYAGAAYLTLSGEKENTGQSGASLDSANKYLARSIRFAPGDEVAYFDLGIVYGRQGQLDSAKHCWDMVEKLNPHFPGLDTNYKVLSQAYLNKGIDLGNNGNVRGGIMYMKKALLIDTANTEILYNIGVAFFRVQEYDSARYAFTKILEYQPGNEDARKGLQALLQIKQ